tara:strand:+ start:570 stop:950 length:381 start_codon:yes stop_codon:yes gene_type:complete
MPRTPPRESRPRRRTQVGTRGRRRRRGTVVRSRRSPSTYPGVSPDYDYGGMVPFDSVWQPERMRTPSPMPDLSDEEIMRNAYRELGYSEDEINRELRGSKKKSKGKKKGKGKKKSKGKKSKKYYMR